MCIGSATNFEENLASALIMTAIAGIIVGNVNCPSSCVRSLFGGFFPLLLNFPYYQAKCPVMPHFTRFSSFAQHWGICCGVKFWVPHQKQNFPILIIALSEMGSESFSKLHSTWEVFRLRPSSSVGADCSS